MDAIVYITDKYLSLTDVEKKLADYIISNYDVALNASVQVLAEKAEVSAATVVRFARQLGFDGFMEFRLFLASNRPLHSDIILDLKTEKGTVEDQIYKVINADIDSMRLTGENLDTSVLKEIAEYIKKANQILLFGTGTSYNVCNDTAFKFKRLGKVTHCYSDIHSATVVMANMSSDDIFIAVSHSGQNRETCGSVEVAKRCGIKTVAITTFPESKISKISDFTLLSKTRESPLHKLAITSRIGQFAVMDALIMAYLVIDYDKCMNHIDKLSEKLTNI